jgi:hypothetical protein
MTTLEEGIFPKDGDHLYVGAYEQAIVLGSTRIVDHSFHRGVPAIVDQARSLLPETNWGQSPISAAAEIGDCPQFGVGAPPPGRASHVRSLLIVGGLQIVIREGEDSDQFTDFDL